MLTRRVRCTQCQTPLAPDIYNTGAFHRCPGCHSPARVEAFAALLAPARIGVAAESLVIDGESSCFFHPSKKAAVACDGCGRFLCSVCDIELDGRHLCPPCLESGKKKGNLQQLQNRRPLYDSMAFAFAVYPVVIFFLIYFTFITAPIAIYLSIRYWNAPGSIVRRSKWRFVVAIIVASVQLIGWAVVVFRLIQ